MLRKIQVMRERRSCCNVELPGDSRHGIAGANPEARSTSRTLSMTANCPTGENRATRITLSVMNVLGLFGRFCAVKSSSRALIPRETVSTSRGVSGSHRINRNCWLRSIESEAIARLKPALVLAAAARTRS